MKTLLLILAIVAAFTWGLTSEIGAIFALVLLILVVHRANVHLKSYGDDN
jgi:hypothetical protein